MISAVVWVALTVWVLVSVTWAIAFLRRDASTIDWVWAPGFAVIAWSTVLVTTSPTEPVSGITVIVLILVTAWAVRLGGYLITRNLQHGEDARYAAFRERGGPGWFWRSYLTVFVLQGALMLVISAPLIVLIVQGGPGIGSTWPVIVGAALALLGMVLEGVADLQLKAFKKSWSNAGKVLQSGLWRYSRHPNYFGNAVMWWGFWIMSLAVPAGVWTIFSPIMMTFLLLKVSGVPLLEKHMEREKPEFQDYRTRTSAFVPWFPMDPT